MTSYKRRLVFQCSINITRISRQEEVMVEKAGIYTINANTDPTTIPLELLRATWIPMPQARPEACLLELQCGMRLLMSHGNPRNTVTEDQYLRSRESN